ncbi:MAG: hypothetical protein M1812_006885 [Candelaria pacifica]|nr:MAG: hypothetical protein M1812_006885 [Candelaria pacifica]
MDTSPQWQDELRKRSVDDRVHDIATITVPKLKGLPGAPHPPTIQQLLALDPIGDDDWNLGVKKLIAKAVVEEKKAAAATKPPPPREETIPQPTTAAEARRWRCEYCGTMGHGQLSCGVWRANAEEEAVYHGLRKDFYKRDC